MAIDLLERVIEGFEKSKNNLGYHFTSLSLI